MKDSCVLGLACVDFVTFIKTCLLKNNNKLINETYVKLSLDRQNMEILELLVATWVVVSTLQRMPWETIKD